MSAAPGMPSGPVDEIRYCVSEMSDSDLRAIARRVLGLMLLTDGSYDTWAGDTDRASGSMVVNGLCEVLSDLRISRRSVTIRGRRAIRAAQEPAPRADPRPTARCSPAAARTRRT